MAVLVKSIVEISATQKILDDFESNDYSSGNYVIRHPNGSELNYNVLDIDKDVEEKEETMIGFIGFSIIIASLFCGLYIICATYSCLLGIYMKFHSSIKEFGLI